MNAKREWDMPVILSILIWICTLPIVAVLVVPVLGWSGGLVAAVILLGVILAVCWILCFGMWWRSKRMIDGKQNRS